jgi:acetyl-CoA synthetase
MKIKLFYFFCFINILFFSACMLKFSAKKGSHMNIEKEESFWSNKAQKIHWMKPFDFVLQGKGPDARWFTGGELNTSYNCVDRHIKAGNEDKVAFYFESERGTTLSLRYKDLYEKVNKYASVLLSLGVKKGDIVVLYLPMIPEAVVMMLACTRIGAIHSVVFSGFSSAALADRIKDAKTSFVVTADVSYRRGKKIQLKKNVDDALCGASYVQKVLVIKRETSSLSMEKGRDVVLDDMLVSADDYVEPVAMNSSDPLFILYTSGTTGTPKGIVHSTGGYLTYVNTTFKYVFNPDSMSVYWCTADIGWITGHSYLVYAPLLYGVTSILYEGTPDYPSWDVWWKLIEKYKVSIFYTAPTALRMCKKNGNQLPKKFDLSSLKVLGSVGEPLNPEIWKWYFNIIGKGECPIVDTWWQTETGGIMIAPRAEQSLISLKEGSVALPLPMIEADVVDENGFSLKYGKKGYLVIKSLWPGMPLGIYNDQERYKELYWKKFEDCYYSGDYAIKDEDGYFWMLGRSDEVLNVAGHRIGTIELENVIISLNFIAEVAVIGMVDDLRGEVPVAFCVLKDAFKKTLLQEEIREKIENSLKNAIGRFVILKNVFFLESLPKTRSGKIMRKLLKKIVQGEDVGDVSTMEDVTLLESILQQFKKSKKESTVIKGTL